MSHNDSGRDYSSPQALYAGTYYDAALSALQGDRVLELGCANGRIGELIRRHAPHVKELHGVDYDAHLLSAAPADLYTSLQQVDLDQAAPHSDEAFTDVLALDVLEHLKAPHEVVGRLVDLLAPRGRLVIGIPNFLHIRNRLRLLAGRWAYEETGGLYDEGHLRWYGWPNLDQLIPRELYDLVEVQGFGWFPRGERLANRPVADWAVRTYLRSVSRTTISLRPRLLARHLVIVCQKREIP